MVKGTAEHADKQKILTAERNQFAKKASEAQKKAEELQSQLQNDGMEVTRLFEENLLLKHEENKLKSEVCSCVLSSMQIAANLLRIYSCIRFL